MILGSLPKKIFKLSNEVDADLIAIMNLADETVLGLYENSFQEEIDLADGKMIKQRSEKENLQNNLRKRYV